MNPPPLRRGVVLAGWVGLLGLLYLVFSGIDPGRRASELQVVPGESGAIVLRRDRSGHYVARGEINRQPVVFLLDTGATSVSISERLAERLGLTRGAPMVAQTANGQVRVYSTKLAEVSLGPITLTNVTGHINPGLGSNQVLLGMSFLRHLDWAQRDGTLTLSPPG